MTIPVALSCPESVTISREHWERIRKLGAAAAGIAVDLMFMANAATGRVVSGTASQTISALGCGSGTFYALVDAGLVKVRPRRDVYLIQQPGTSVPKKDVQCAESEQIATTTTSFVSLSGDREEEVQEKKGAASVPKQPFERTETVQASPLAPVEPTREMHKLAKQVLDMIPGATVNQVAIAIAQGTRFLREEFRPMLRWIVQDGAGTTADQHTAGAIRTGDPLRYFVGVLKRKSADTRGLRLMVGRVQEEDAPTAQGKAQRPKQAGGELPMSKGWGNSNHNPGPRWTTGHKPVGHYDYANVGFQRNGQRPGNVFLQREKHDDAYYEHIYKRFDDEPKQDAVAQ